MVSEKTLEKIRNLAKEPIEAVFTDPSYGKVDTVLQYDILKPYVFFFGFHLLLGGCFLSA